jgi:hypothetical protein
MNAQQERRWSRLKIAILAIPLFVVGTMAMAPVSVVRPVLDPEGQPTYRADGRAMMEPDHWGNFQVNWIGYSLVYSATGLLVWGVGSWLFVGLTDRPKTSSVQMKRADYTSNASE